MADECKKKVECFPSQPVSCRICGEFNLSGQLTIPDLIAKEYTETIGTKVELYQLDRVKSTVDPLYGEAIEYVWGGPFVLFGYVSYPEPVQEVKREGYKETRSPEVWLARASVEAVGARAPRESDVVGFWNIPYFNNDAVTNKSSPIKRLFFNVTGVIEDGFQSVNPEFVGFKLTTNRNTEFAPERRVTNR
jgi:hypothetical protein